jgi:hypothetical protein
MYRKPNWEVALAAYLEPLRLVPFAWGTHDCCTFAGGAVLAMTGLDPMVEFRGRYSTELGAKRALRRIGRGTLVATLDAKFEPVPASLAQRGDIVMVGGLLAICWGAFAIAVGREDDREGLIRIDRAQWHEARAWRVQFGA